MVYGAIYIYNRPAGVPARLQRLHIYIARPDLAYCERCARGIICVTMQCQGLLPGAGVMHLHVMSSPCWLSGVHGGSACWGHLLACDALQHPGGAAGRAPAAVRCGDDT